MSSNSIDGLIETIRTLNLEVLSISHSRDQFNAASILGNSDKEIEDYITKAAAMNAQYEFDLAKLASSLESLQNELDTCLSRQMSSQRLGAKPSQAARAILPPPPPPVFVPSQEGQIYQRHMAEIARLTDHNRTLREHNQDLYNRLQDEQVSGMRNREEQARLREEQARLREEQARLREENERLRGVASPGRCFPDPTVSSLFCQGSVYTPPPLNQSKEEERRAVALAATLERLDKANTRGMSKNKPLSSLGGGGSGRP